jgi:hypothetical protein
VRVLRQIVRNTAANKIVYILVACFTLSVSSLFSQSQQTKPTRQSALDAISKGDFELAYTQFSELLESYPGDPLYKYYCGVSLVKLERDPAKALILLKEAQKGSAAIRTIPVDATFYIGRAFQLTGNYTEAINSYSTYTEQVGKKTAKEALTQDYIQQCSGKKGAIVSGQASEKEVEKEPAISKIIIKEKTTGLNNENPKADAGDKEETNLPEQYENIINEALNYQFRADSLTKITDFYKKQLEKVPVQEKAKLKLKISETEKLAVATQKLADNKQLEGAILIRPSEGQTPSQERKIATDSLSIEKETLQVILQKGTLIPKDTMSAIKNETFSMVVKQKSNNEIFKDTTKQNTPNNINKSASQKTAEKFSLFEIIAKPVYVPGEKVMINPVVPPGLIYRIQLAVFKNPVAPVYFKGITPVYGFKNDGSEVTNYYAGMFRKSADASKALGKVKSSGFKDAFVVATMDKKNVSAERAVILEKEWGNKAFKLSEEQKAPYITRDTIPQTLTFRVEVAKSQKPLKTEQLGIIKRLAGSRGLDIFSNPSGQYIYLIGKFLTFESAAEYADLLTRNGMKEAKVTAYLGKREIPVETAKQLFEKY